MKQVLFKQTFYSLLLFLVANGILIVNGMSAVKIVVYYQNSSNGKHKYAE